MPTISQSVAKELWYRAGGRCAFAHKLELSYPDSGKLFGEIAHIVASSPDGPRGDPNFPSGKLHSCENLILLCPDHHTEVDTDYPTWTVAKLRALKESHEEWVRQRLKWVEPSVNESTAASMLVVLWGASGSGKDVVLNSVRMRLEKRCPVINLPRFTTRPRRPEEAEQTPFKYLDTDGFSAKVSRGEVSCVHTANDNFYGFDIPFADRTPPGTVMLTCMRQFLYLNELNIRAGARGLAVYNILLKADYNTVELRTQLRGTRAEEKSVRLMALQEDIEWFDQNESNGQFDLILDNSNNACLNNVVDATFDFIMRMRMPK